MGSRASAESLLTLAPLAAVLAACTLADLRERTVPDRALAIGAACALAGIAATDPDALGSRLLAATAAGLFLLVPALAFPGSMGLGDVKLAAVLGLFLGPAVAGALLAAFCAGTLAGAVLFARHGRVFCGMTIPFVPYMALGTGVAVLGGL